MTDIFQSLNELSIKMQGKYENMLTCSDKFKGFKPKILLWKIELSQDHRKCFQEAIKIEFLTKSLCWIWCNNI